MDGYRATVGVAIDTDTIDRHRDGADGGGIAEGVGTFTGGDGRAASVRTLADGYRIAARYFL